MLQDTDDSADFESPARARQLLARHLDPQDVLIDRQLVYTFNALVADRWRAGRILLAGDAAHMTPQFVGQGMNAGLRDADNLSWKIADVILRQADPSLLDTYESERRPHAKSMIGISVFNKDIVSTARPGAIRARDLGIGATMRVPGLRRVLTEAKLKPRPRYRRGSCFGMPRGPLGVEATLAPQPVVRTRAGGSARLDDATGSGWAVIGIGVDPRRVIDPLDWAPVQPTWTRLFPAGGRLRSVTGRREPDDPKLIDLEAHDAMLVHWLRRASITTGDVVVLRPDHYVFAIVHAALGGFLSRAGSRRAASERAGARAVGLLHSRYPSNETVSP